MHASRGKNGNLARAKPILFFHHKHGSSNKSNKKINKTKKIAYNCYTLTKYQRQTYFYTVQQIFIKTYLQ